MEENHGGELNPFAQPQRPQQNPYAGQNPYQSQNPYAGQDPYQGQPTYQGQNPYSGQYQNPYTPFAGPAGTQPADPFHPGASSVDVQSYDPYKGLQLYSQQIPEGYSREEQKKTGKKAGGIGKWIGLSAGILAVGAVLVLWLLGFFHSKNGTYIWDDYQVFGMTVELKIDGDTADLTITADGKPQTQKCNVAFDSDKVVLSMNGKYLNCEYNRKKQTITIPDDAYLNSDLVLEKE